MKEILNPKKAAVVSFHAERRTLIFGSVLLVVAAATIYIESKVNLLVFYVVPALYILLVAAFYALVSYKEKLAARFNGTPDRHYLQAILNSSQEMVWAIDMSYKLVAFNEAFRSSILLFSGHDCKIGDHVLSIDFGDSTQRWKAHYDKALRGMSFTFQDKVLDNTHPIYFENTMQPLRLGAKGQIVGVSCFSKDITWKVNQEEKLAESNRRLNAALEIGEIGFWEYNQPSDRVELSENMYEMLGYSPTEVGATSHSWQALIHPDDVKATIEDFHSQINGPSGQVTLSYRVLGKNGNVFWMSAKGSVVERNSAGKVLRAIGTQHNVTSQKVYEEQLKRLSLVASRTHNGVVILNSDMLVEWANDAYETVTGYQLSRIKGKNHVDHLFARETNPQTVQRIKDSLTSHSIVREEVQCVKPSGEKLWLLLEITPIFDEHGELEHFVSIETDITDKKQKEYQRILLESAVKNVAEAVLIVSKSPDQHARDFKVVYANDAFFRITGYGEDEVVGGSPVKLLKGPKTESAKLVRIFDAVSSESYLEEEVISYKKSGEALWVSLALSPVGGLQSEENHFFVAIVKDINDRKAAQEEKQSLSQELVNRNKELQEFTQVVSHNLRAPVANILGLANIFDRSQALSDYNQKIMTHLVEAAGRLDTVLVDLNDILKVRETAMASKQQFKLKEMISQVLGSFMLQSDELNASIDVDIAPDDLEIHSVRGYFHSVIHNLVSNGLKYRHPSRAPKLRINAYTTNTDLVMIFTDNGLGMDMKQVGEKMFKLYKRFHSHVEGKGMGLFLVKTQVERIGGTISVRSVLGKGTAFRVVIPLEDYQPITTETDSESV